MHQKGEGHQVTNAHHSLRRTKDEQRWVVRLLLWEIEWSGDWQIQLGWKDRGLQGCEEDFMIIAGELPYQEDDVC